MIRRKTRLAPSPTGALHLGNARSFLINWLLARQNGWEILLRIDNLDGPRVKRGADLQAMEDLRWLGLDWVGQAIYQSQRGSLYTEAINRLLAGGFAYPCICSRSEVRSAASAPHAEDGSHHYPGTCRGRFQSLDAARIASQREPAIRFRVPEGIVEFKDGFAGMQRFDADAHLGDFVIAKGDGTPAYQLAVVVDDAEMGITDIVRGNDLIESTARQILIYRSLGLDAPLPNWVHLPLVLGTDGLRLAKRHGDSRLAYYRSKGATPSRVLALLARWCGIAGAGENESAKQLIGRFDLSQLPREPITFTKEDEAFLLDGAISGPGNAAR
jgi:glutamyl-tRNA synthetase